MALLERADQLRATSEYLADAAGGHGRLVYVSGEAGIGKSSFVRHVLDDAAGAARCGVGGCDGSSTPAPLGALLDLLPVLPPDVWPEGASRHDVFARLVQTLREPGPAPWLLVVEDLHWADEATLDLVRHLARRIHECRALVLVTYRPDEVPSVPGLRSLLGDTASASGTRRIGLPPLTRDAVATLVAASATRRPVDADRLHAVTGGNAFFVTEVLASAETDTEQVPQSVRDAVLGRVARLDEPTRHALEIVALAGAQAEIGLVEEVVRGGMSALDEPMAKGVLVLADDAVAFRHELGRRAVADEVPAGRRVHVHRRLLAALTARGADPARLAHHADGAADSAAVLLHAPVAAAQAAALGAHRQAVEQYRRCLRHAGRTAASALSASGRADLLLALGYELYLTNEMTEAAASVEAARAIWEDLGQTQREGDAWRRLSRISWFAGSFDLAEEQGRRAIEHLEAAGPSPALALAYSNAAQQRMLASDLAGTREWSERALSTVDRLPPGRETQEIRSHALNNLGTVEATASLGDDGAALLEESLRLALAADLHDHAARAYVNLATTAMLRRDRGATRWFEEGVAYCTARDLDVSAAYLEGALATWHLHRGRHRDAIRVAKALLDRPAVRASAFVEPLTVMAVAASRSGDGDAAAPLLRAADLLGARHEAMWFSPLVAARAEIAWTGGRPREASAAAAEGWQHVRDVECLWYRGAVGRWLEPGTSEHAEALAGALAPPFRAEAEGRWLDAAALWTSLDCPFDAGLALARAGTQDGLTKSVAVFESVGAQAAADRARALLRHAGWPVPRAARAATRAHPAGLTAREAEVLALLVEGLSDAAIAERLVISRRTAEHHVSSILAKTGASARGELAEMGGVGGRDG